MDHNEAYAIRRLSPDRLPANLQYLFQEADRVLKLRQTMCVAGDSHDAAALALTIPVLSIAQRERVNAVLLAHLAMVCGKLQCWGGPGKAKLPVKPIEVLPAVGGVSVAIGDRPQRAPLMWETTT